MIWILEKGQARASKCFSDGALRFKKKKKREGANRNRMESAVANKFMPLRIFALLSFQESPAAA